MVQNDIHWILSKPRSHFDSKVLNQKLLNMRFTLLSSDCKIRKSSGCQAMPSELTREAGANQAMIPLESNVSKRKRTQVFI